MTDEVFAYVTAISNNMHQISSLKPFRLMWHSWLSPMLQCPMCCFYINSFPTFCTYSLNSLIHWSSSFVFVRHQHLINNHLTSKWH